MDDHKPYNMFWPWWSMCIWLRSYMQGLLQNKIREVRGALIDWHIFRSLRCFGTTVATWLFKVYRFALTTRLALGIEVGLQDFQLQVFSVCNHHSWHTLAYAVFGNCCLTRNWGQHTFPNLLPKNKTEMNEASPNPKLESNFKHVHTVSTYRQVADGCSMRCKHSCECGCTWYYTIRNMYIYTYIYMIIYVMIWCGWPISFLQVCTRRSHGQHQAKFWNLKVQPEKYAMNRYEIYECVWVKIWNPETIRDQWCCLFEPHTPFWKPNFDQPPMASFKDL